MSSAPTPTSPPAPPAGGGTNSTSPPAVVTPPSSSPSTPNTTAPASAPPAVPSASPPAQASTPPPASTTPPPSSTPTTPAVPSSPSPPAGGGSTPAVPSSPSPPSGGGSSSGGGGSTTPSAPTPPSRNSPPTSSNATPTSGSSGSSSSSSGSSGVSTPLVVGVAVGGAVLLIIITLICVCCRRRKRSDRPPPGYYGGPPRKEETYNGGQVQGWHQTAPPPPSDHIVKIPPQPHMSPPPSHASRPPLPSSQPPPPPPPHYSSSGVSSSNYSGPDGGVFLPPPPPPPNMGGFSKNMFTYEELSIATDAFSDANLLGQGGFGYVHRGMLMSGEEIAVKQLKAGSGQGEREFQAEVEIISRVHHKHLVSLIGYCMTGSKRMLVYEFVANNTLEFHLHGKGRPVMAWPSRLKIAIGSARGLAYLHEDCHPKIIHRDIKAANILLDFKFEAKVADFGLAKFSSDTNTHVSTRVMGTFGYMAPEYASSGKLTEKSDVFSYGVMLLEMITGKRPVDSSLAHTDDSLVDWARPLLTRAIEDKTYDALADPRLQGNYDHGEMARMVACAAACVRHSARRRPRMSQVVRALEGDVSLDDLNDGVRPGHSSVYGTSMGSSDYDSGMYREDLRNFRRLALETSQEYASTEYSEPTSEYGQNPSGSSGENPSRETRSKTPATRTPNDSRGF